MTKPNEDTKIAQFSIYDYIEAGADPALSFYAGLALQYYPESISVGRGVDYATKKPIGGSHPLYQWVHGSERTLSVDSIFTAEVDLWKGGAPDAISDVEKLATSVSNFLKNPITAAINATRGSQTVDYGQNHVDVASAVAWLQSKTYPLYDKSKISVKPPPKLALYLPNSGIQTFIEGLPLDDTFFCVMTRCDVRYTAFFRSGAPRIAEVSLTFDEIVQVGQKWGFVSRDSFVYNKDVAKRTGKTEPKYGYSVAPNENPNVPSISQPSSTNSLEGVLKSGRTAIQTILTG